MFYLRELIKYIFTSNRFRGLFFILTTLALFLGTANIDRIEDRFSYISDDISQYDYFNSLIDKKQNINRVVRRVRELPGIKAIEITPPEKVKNYIDEILNDLNLNLSSKFFSLNYAGVKVYFEKEINQSTIKLVRDYMTRMSGEENIFIGSTVTNSHKINRTFETFENYAVKLILLMTFLIWVPLSLLFIKGFRNHCYILEQYQRKKEILLKTMIGFTILTTFLCAGSTIYMYGNLNVLYFSSTFLLMLSLIILQVRKKAWSY